MKKLMIIGTVLTFVLTTGTIVYAKNTNQQISLAEDTKVVRDGTLTANMLKSNLSYVSTDHRAETNAIHSQHSTTEHNGATGKSATYESTHVGHDATKENNHREHRANTHSYSTTKNRNLGHDTLKSSSHINQSTSKHR